MFYIRTVKTKSKSTAVQVIRYQDRKRIIVKHIGSAHNNQEILALKKIAYKWIDNKTKQQILFPLEKKEVSTLVPIEKLQNLGFRYTLAQEIITELFHIFQFTGLNNQLLLDLVMMRIIQPASKLESLKLLSEYFGIEHKRTELYRNIETIISMKGIAEKKVLYFVKKYFAFDFSIIFYDVTTLYFETFQQDEDTKEEKGLRKRGFSKDNKVNQPQIVIGLIVSREGFPISYNIFEGNTFEDKTFIPVITKFKETYEIENLIVVADAAMLSFSNVENLVMNELSYIVGARIGNLKLEQIKKINKVIGGVDGTSTRIKTKRGLLICDFSVKRYKKDKHEMENQIQKATYLINRPSKNKKSKFLKNTGKTGYVLNTELIEKTNLLLGIRGYYTNLTTQTDQSIILRDKPLRHIF